MNKPRGAAPGDDLAHEFGQLYAGLTDDELTVAQLAAQRARLLMRARAERLDASGAALVPGFSWSSISGWRVPVLALAAMLAVWLGGTHWFGNDPVLEAEWRGEAVQEGTEFSTVAGKSGAELGFSDGSRVVLEADTAGQLVTLAEKQTVVRLHRGRVAADINRDTGASWDILAGPYRVSVIGTKFTVNWEPATERFEVRVGRGLVRVAGGKLDGGGVSLGAGQSVLRARSEPPPSTVVEKTGVVDSPAATESAAPAEPKSSARRARRQGVVRAQTQVTDTPLPAPEPSWKDLAESGKYEAAFKAATTVGFSALLADEGPEGLLLLANTTRYAGRSQSARTAYETLRTRHAGSPGARMAAFYLARIAQDATHQPRVAVQWLRTYLRESPGGPLAASARARLIDTLLQFGDGAGAKEVAKDYIRLHPQGSHVGLARSLLRDSKRRGVARER